MTDSGRDARLALLANRQAGQFTAAQAMSIGFPRTTIHRRLATDAWVRVHQGVYAVGASRPSRAGELWAASLAVGPASVVSHETAALVHGAENLDPHPIVLTNPHGWHHHLSGIFVHQISDLGPIDIVKVDGLAVSSPARCVVELGATQPLEVVGRVCDDLVASRRTTLRAIETAFARVARPGKPGLGVVARVLDKRADGDPLPATELERLLFRVLEAGGLPAPRRQFPLPGRGNLRGLVDAAFVEARLILEADGRRWHARVEAARRDRQRDAEAARVGWQTLRFGFEELTRSPAEVCAVVDDTLRVRLGRSAAA